MNQAQETMQSVPQPDLDSYTDLNVGEILRRTREHYGQTLSQVEANLRIRGSQLEALENLELEKLPGRVYAIGFVRAYSEYLGLDGAKMVHLFKAQSVGKRVKPELRYPVTMTEGQTPSLNVILFSMVAAILFISYLSIFHTPTKYVESIPPVPEALKASNLVPKIITEEQEPGDKYIVPEEEGLLLSTGNAGGITVFIDGKKIDKLGQSSQVKRNIALKPSNFTEDQ